MDYMPNVTLHSVLYFKGAVCDVSRFKKKIQRLRNFNIRPSLHT